jgi:hypothetical protein
MYSAALVRIVAWGKIVSYRAEAMEKFHCVEERVRLNNYLIQLLCWRKALQIFLQVLAARVTLVDNAQTGHPITKRSNLLVEICAVPLLDHIVCYLLRP